MTVTEAKEIWTNAPFKDNYIAVASSLPHSEWVKLLESVKINRAHLRDFSNDCFQRGIPEKEFMLHWIDNFKRYYRENGVPDTITSVILYLLGEPVRDYYLADLALRSVLLITK